mmetsp:Transcript_4881/g.7412  ORF Transcript_4881/g.7412 Transcript_4881/m.7412 type:complete len:248 (+) Transcript_4881:639-1382(+)
MTIQIRSSGFEHINNLSLCIQNTFINDLLLGGKLLRGGTREGTSHITPVAKIFSAHVEQARFSILKLTIIGCPSMTIMQYSCIRSTSTNGGVTHMPRPKIVVNEMTKKGLSLILHHSRFHIFHSEYMRKGSNFCAVSNEIKLHLRFNNSALCKDWKEYLIVHYNVFGGEGRRFVFISRITVEPLHAQNLPTACTEVLQCSFNIICIHDIIDLVCFLDVHICRNVSHNRSIVLGKFWSKQYTLSRLQV